MITKPTIYLSNWSSYRTPGHHGPGRPFTIMARPRAWERGVGDIFQLTRREEDLVAVQHSQISMGTYRERFIDRAKHLGHLAPGELKAARTGVGVVAEVSDGDTICCACSRDAAARGECHRVWAAELLVEAGWRVILDGVELVDEVAR